MATKKTTTFDSTIYSQEGKKVGSITVPEAIFGSHWNADLVHQVVTGMQANARQGNAHAKDRSEVAGGGKKPWKQKGTGRARHGSSRSPIWRKGGVTHGPRNDKDYSVAIPKKMRAKALYVALAKKFAEGEIMFIDKLSFSETKTKLARETLNKLGSVDGYTTVATRRKNAAFIALPGKDTVVMKSFSNMGNVRVAPVSDLNVVDVLSYRVLVMVAPEEGIKFIESKMK